MNTAFKNVKYYPMEMFSLCRSKDRVWPTGRRCGGVLSLHVKNFFKELSNNGNAALRTQVLLSGSVNTEPGEPRQGCHMHRQASTAGQRPEAPTFQI